MKVRAMARSISRPVRERLQQGSFVARLLAVFDHACDLVTPDGGVVALVTPQIGNGPLNVVVEVEPGNFAAVEPGMAAMLDGGRLRAGGLVVVLDKATVWEPCPDWSALRARRATVVGRLSLLWTIALRHAPAGNLLEIISGREARDAISPRGDVLSAVIWEAVEALRAGWEGDIALLQKGAAQLSGLGSGLTPAGDDFLTGVMLWAWLAHPSPRFFCRVLLEVAAPRTTTLSAAFLRVAAQGECSAPWHRMLAALASGAAEDELVVIVQEVLAHGATSGADALAGFLWVGSQALW
ncbi:MAG TPA: DUF2877 domain-containing protein, partial [Anaerolineae bacterium]|nr:DUF2877 domain-containing protein [Anaerolineae bacterium]